MNIIRENKCLNHLAHAGEMGKRIATFDWQSTPMGDPSKWPANLITALGIMLENKFPMYIVWGQNLIQFYNDAYIELLGDKHPKALGSTPSVTWSELWEEISPLFESVFNGENVRFDDHPMTINYNGRMVQRYFNFTYCPIRNADGTVGGVLDTVIDTTSDVLNKKALSRNEEKFRILLEAAPMPFLSMDKNWVVDYINPSALALMKMEIEELIGYTIWEVFPSLRGSVFEEAYHKAMDLGENASIIGYFPDFGRWYQVWAYPFNQGIAVSFIDINESKRLEQKLNEAIIVRDDFLSISSHELNTPLTSLKIQSQLLKRDIVSGNPKAFEEARIRRFSDHTEKQVSRLTRLIDDMLDVARIRSGKLTIKKETFDLAQFVKEVVIRMDPHFKVAGLEYPEFKITGCTQVIGEWDSMRIEQVISNLINNAIRYGEGKPIALALECKGNKIIFSVKDHGIGIEKSSMERIFDRFERASEKQQTKGLGLGLYIANQIIAAHNGRIWAESTVGEGSTFYVELPWNPPT
nr:ATP-binding protein [Bacteriovorax sp. HI3]